MLTEVETKSYGIRWPGKSSSSNNALRIERVNKDSKNIGSVFSKNSRKSRDIFLQEGTIKLRGRIVDVKMISLVLFVCFSISQNPILVLGHIQLLSDNFLFSFLSISLELF
jgi:hypothetical protein